MTLIPLQIVLLVLIATVVVWSLVEMHRRQRRSWQEIVVRMSPECRQAWGERSPDRSKGVTAAWIRSPRLAFRDAGVLMEMADYTERNAVTFDPLFLHRFRNTAVRLRLTAARAMVRRISPR